MILFLLICGVLAALAVFLTRVHKRRRERALAEVYQRHFPPELMARLGQGGGAAVPERGAAAGAGLASQALLAAAPATVAAPPAAAVAPDARADAGGSGHYLGAWHEREVRFVLVAVAGDSGELVSRRLGQACDAAARFRWTVQALVCNVAVLVDGTLAGTLPAAMSGEMLAAELLGLLKTEAKAVHGVCQAPVGDVGRQRTAWGAILPPFLEAMKALAELPYGTVGRQ